MKTCKTLSALLVVAALSANAQFRYTDPNPTDVRHLESADGQARHRILHVSRPLQEQEQTGFHANAVSATIPMWQAKDGSYTYTMVGTDPTSTNVTTTIPTQIIPVVLTFSDGNTFDPTVKDACASQSPTNLVLSSPVFSNSQFTVGGTNVGNTQYLDYFQRANFWQSVKTNTNYHVTLAPAVQPALKVTVPAASGRTIAANCGRLGEMDINYFDSLLSTQFPKLAATVTPSTLPVFLLYNVVMYDTKVTNCCILGYHSAFNSSTFGGAVQTYSVAEYDTSNDFGKTTDISVLSHEIGEWLDDPTGGNPTPAWGGTGQVSGCQSNLEVGDPLSGTIVTVTMSNATTYHLQELAFKSWFYRDAVSSGVNGWYSSNGSFTKPAGACTSSTTSLTLSPTSLSPGSSTQVTIGVKPSTGSGTPTGTVKLVSNATGSPTLATYTLANGAATGNLVPPAGAYSITASYSGDATFLASNSAAVAITVGSPTNTLSPVALSFGNQNVASASAGQVVKLSNTGTAALKITGITITGASPGDFTQSNNCAPTMPVNTSCTISVVFKPTAAGARTAAISVADNIAGSPQTVPLSGTGVAIPTAPKAVLGATSYAFGSLATGTTASHAVTLSNTGTAALTGIAVTVTGVNASEFSQTNTCGTSLAVNATCAITVIFKPATVGNKAASISIADNAVPSPQTVTLSGAALAAAPTIASISPTSLKVNVATVVTVNGAHFQQGFTASFTSGNKPPTALTFTNSGLIKLTVTPTTVATGLLTITNPDGQKVSTTIQVTR